MLIFISMCTYIYLYVCVYVYKFFGVLYKILYFVCLILILILIWPLILNLEWRCVWVFSVCPPCFFAWVLTSNFLFTHVSCFPVFSNHSELRRQGGLVCTVTVIYQHCITARAAVSSNNRNRWEACLTVVVLFFVYSSTRWYNCTIAWAYVLTPSTSWTPYWRILHVEETYMQ